MFIYRKKCLIGHQGDSGINAHYLDKESLSSQHTKDINNFQCKKLQLYSAIACHIVSICCHHMATKCIICFTIPCYQMLPIYAPNCTSIDWTKLDVQTVSDTKRHYRQDKARHYRVNKTEQG